MGCTNIILSPDAISSGEKYKDYVEEIKELKSNRLITENQQKGILLEIVCYLALRNIGVVPIPLHNPFDRDYPLDNHLDIDLIFRHEGLTYGVECKNTSIRWSWSTKWIKDEVIARFDNVMKVVPIDCKVIVSSYDPLERRILKDYSVLALGEQVTLDTIYEAVLTMTKLYLSLFRRKRPEDSLYTVHGSPNRERMKLRYIQKRLSNAYGNRKELE